MTISEQTFNFPTPIQHCPAISELSGVSVFLKREDLADSIGSGNKARKIPKIINYLKSHGIMDVICDGTTQSNSCASLAYYAQKNGITSHLIVYGDTRPVGNYKSMIDNKADLSHIGDWDPEEIAVQRLAVIKRLKASGRQVLNLPTGLSCELTVSGSAEIAREIHEYEAATGTVFSDIFVAAGTGSTVAGLAFEDGIITQAQRVRGAMIANDATFFSSEIQLYYDYLVQIDNQKGRPAPPTLLDATYGGYGSVTEEVSELQSYLSRQGLQFDITYMAKTIACAIKYIREHPENKAPRLIIHTGGNDHQQQTGVTRQ